MDADTYARLIDACIRAGKASFENTLSMTVEENLAYEGDDWGSDAGETGCTRIVLKAYLDAGHGTPDERLWVSRIYKWLGEPATPDSELWTAISRPLAETVLRILEQSGDDFRLGVLEHVGNVKATLKFNLNC